MREDGVFDHRQSLCEIDLPEGLAEFDVGVSAPDVIHENVQFPLLLANPRDQLLHLLCIAMVHDNGDALAAARVHHFRCFFNRLRPPCEIER